MGRGEDVTIREDRWLIEDYLPIEAISKEASREKSARKGHICTLHLWWARRRLAAATQEQRENLVVSPSGYGIHWPELDENLSVDGLIGIRHHSPFGETAEKNSRKKEIMATAP